VLEHGLFVRRLLVLLPLPRASRSRPGCVIVVIVVFAVVICFRSFISTAICTNTTTINFSFDKHAQRR
jgi:hypothetical protein